MNDANKIRAIEAYAKCMEKATQLFPALRGIDIPLVFEDVGARTIGLATYWPVKKTSLNPKFLTVNPDKVINDTIPHEIAHHVTRLYYPHAKQAHGPEWKRICAMLGGSSKRCSSNLDFEGIVLRRNKIKRWLYQNANGDQLHLTKAQHEKCQMGYRFRTKKSNTYFGAAEYTGKIISVQR